MPNEPKRIEVVVTASLGAGGKADSRFGPGTGTILRRMVNYHNIWFGFSVVPVAADANAEGTWVLWQKRDTNTTDPVFSPGIISGGDINMVIIACGVWAAANQMPYNFSSQLKTSRNLVANQELVLTVRVNNITTSTVTIFTSLCAGLSVK